MTKKHSVVEKDVINKCAYFLLRKPKICTLSEK